MITPLSDLFTRSTCSACSSIGIFLCIIPIPPSRAIAIASADSVTVSMAELMNGIFNFTPGASTVETSISLPNTSDFLGTNNTSSNVKPSLPNLSSLTAYHILLKPSIKRKLDS
ncbi:hypothetical protein D3C85_1318800 [compost metagenome]